MYGKQPSSVVYILSMNVSKKTENCTVCGSTLEYLHQSENLVCIYCGATEQGHVKCPEGHFTCEECHRRDAMQMIEGMIVTTELQDPIAIA
jgi:ribosomal protein L34E